MYYLAQKKGLGIKAGQYIYAFWRQKVGPSQHLGWRVTSALTWSPQAAPAVGYRSVACSAPMFSRLRATPRAQEAAGGFFLGSGARAQPEGGSGDEEPPAPRQRWEPRGAVSASPGSGAAAPAAARAAGPGAAARRAQQSLGGGGRGGSGSVSAVPTAAAASSAQEVRSLSSPSWQVLLGPCRKLLLLCAAGGSGSSCPAGPAGELCPSSSLTWKVLRQEN